MAHREPDDVNTFIARTAELAEPFQMTTREVTPTYYARPGDAGKIGA